MTDVARHPDLVRPSLIPESALLGIQSVGKMFGTFTALEGANFDIRDNEFFTLLGPSGCGKTTLLRMIAGFEHPTSGCILLEGKDVAALPPFRRPVNTMFQSYALFPHLDVRRNVAYGLERLGWKSADVRARVDEVLDLVQMTAFADRRTTEMSGGQQQRVALARALAPRPRVLLLDEPLSALDLKLRKAMQVELKRLQRETAVTFVMVTHDQEEALALSDRMAVMNRGRVLQVGTPEEVYVRPATRFVADFIGEANLIPGELVGLHAGCTVTIRPEHLILGGGDGTGRSLAATLSSLTFLGADTLIEAKTGDVPLRARHRGALAGFAPGDEINLGWDPAREWVLAE